MGWGDIWAGVGGAANGLQDVFAMLLQRDDQRRREKLALQERDQAKLVDATRWRTGYEADQEHNAYVRSQNASRASAEAAKFAEERQVRQAEQEQRRAAISALPAGPARTLAELEAAGIKGLDIHAAEGPAHGEHVAADAARELETFKTKETFKNSLISPSEARLRAQPTRRAGVDPSDRAYNRAFDTYLREAPDDVEGAVEAGQRAYDADKAARGNRGGVPVTSLKLGAGAIESEMPTAGAPGDIDLSGKVPTGRSALPSLGGRAAPVRPMAAHAPTRPGIAPLAAPGGPAAPLARPMGPAATPPAAPVGAPTSGKAVTMGQLALVARKNGSTVEQERQRAEAEGFIVR